MKKNGFTLIEFVIVIVLMSIILAAATRILCAGFSNYLTAKNITDAEWQARVAIERMARELRSAVIITSSGAASLTFTDNTNTVINYQLSGTNLIRNSQILADGVSLLAFTYYNQNGIVSASNIRFIAVNLGISKNNTNYAIKTTINLRDLT